MTEDRGASFVAIRTVTAPESKAIVKLGAKITPDGLLIGMTVEDKKTGTRDEYGAAIDYQSARQLLKKVAAFMSMSAPRETQTRDDSNSGYGPQNP